VDNEPPELITLVLLKPPVNKYKIICLHHDLR
jgi:hypothetical protein